jgi:uncharacterized protein YjdB
MRHHQFRTQLFASLIVLSVAACGGDTTTSVDAQKLTGTTAGGGSPTTVGAAATIVISPGALALTVGNYGAVQAIVRDASGAAITDRRPTWHSSDDNIIAVVGDSGVVRAKAIGTAMIYASMDGHEASVQVTVSAAPAPVPDPSIVSSFALKLTTVGTLAGTDTSRVEIVPGATVTVTRTKSMTGETLATPVVVATLTTDANGAASVDNVPGGYYQLVATPPAGSPYVTTTASLGAPTSAVATYRLVLRRN